ncbi:histidine phosphatase family protein [Candidatus Woesearchaeota archaeon]|nr:histidine phosphatase family protein [Candidatus Woesearchaeota archaeon]
MRIYFIRPGETEFSKQGKIQGMFNSPLTEKGVASAQAKGIMMQNYGIDIIVSSTIVDASSTAEIIGQYTGITPLFSKRINEMHFGEWTGMSLSEVELSRPLEYMHWKMSKYDFIIPCGDSYQTVEMRSRTLVDNVMERLEDRAAIISGEHVAKTMLGYLLDMPKEDMIRIRQPYDIIYFIDTMYQRYGYLNLKNGITMCDELITAD